MRRVLRAWLRPAGCAAGLLVAACDMGARDDAPAHGPDLHIVASYPADGQGTNAASDAEANCTSPTPDCPVPTNAVIELRFDRFLIPSGGLAAGLGLYTGNPPANGVSMRAEYDVIERVVVFRPTRPLQPNTLYTAQVLVGNSDPGLGFWAFDRAPLAEGPVPLRFSFTTGSGPRAVEPALERMADTCETMTRGPFGGCVSCHVTRPGEETVPPSKFPPMGLDLSSSRGLFYTAVSHVAHQAQNDLSRAGLQAPLRFGVQMNLIDPGNPATSYLLYKLLQKPANYQLASSEPECVTAYHSPVAEGGCTPPDDAEAQRMREWFLRGEPMPKNTRDELGQEVPAATNHATLVRIASWISDGATCPEPQ